MNSQGNSGSLLGQASNGFIQAQGPAPLTLWACCEQCEKPTEVQVPDYVMREVLAYYSAPQPCGPTYEKRHYIVCENGHEQRLTQDTRFRLRS